MKLKSLLATTALCAGIASPTIAGAWSLEEAAAPYAGTTVDVVFLLRPGYEAIEAMLPAFEEATGIDVNIIKHPYENALGEQVRDFVAGGDLDIALIDLVWIGNFVENEWVVSVDEIMETYPDIIDPELNMDDFFPLVLNAFGGWNDTIYGLGAGVWARSAHTSYRAGRAVEAGRVWTNCYHIYPAHAAFGGYKKSGIGRENHRMMLDHYQQTKNLLVSYSTKPAGFF